MKKQLFKPSLMAALVLLLGVVTLVGCGSNDEPANEEEVTEAPTEYEEEAEESIRVADFVGTWSEDDQMRLLLAADGTGDWIDMFDNFEWEVVGNEFHIHLPDDMLARFYFEFEDDTLFLDSIIAEDIEFHFVRMSYEVLEIEEHPLLSASNEEIQQAVLDALNEADSEVYRELTGFASEQEFIAGLLGVDPTVVFQVMNQGVRSGNRTTSVSVQRLDRLGNVFSAANRRYATEDIFLYWDFLYEFDEDEDLLRLIMRHHFDIELDMSGVTRENFDAIEIGMSLDEVSALLGSEGSLGVTSGNHEVRTWSREFGGGTTVIISIYFIDDHVTSLSQIGW
ncbi:MAG: hypothetical protein FWE07_05265 [Turicibacter sp.]|nr:hypothetical protein [Turicibacter sp.]